MNQARDDYRNLLDQVPALAWLSGLDARRSFVNRAWLGFTGRSLAQEVGEGWLECVHPEERDSIVQAYRQAAASREPFEVEYRLRNRLGEYSWVREAGRPLFEASGEFAGFVGVCTDINRQKEMEKALQEGETLFKGLFEHAPDGVLAVDGQGRIMLANRRVENMFGYSSRELMGRTIQMLLPGDVRSRHEQHVKDFLLQPHLRPMGAHLDLMARRRDGSQFPVDITLGPLQVGERNLVLATIRDITERKQAEGELRLYKNHLEELVEQRTAELQREVAERKHAEEMVRQNQAALKSIAVRLARSNRDLQDFASIVSHDLQEPLRKITAFGERLKNQFASDLGPEGLDYLDRMQAASGRMQTMLNDLLTYSRVTTKAKPYEAVDLNQTLADVVSDLEIRIEETGGRVEVSQLPTVEAEPLQIHQLFQNLVANGLKFHHPGAAPLVKVYTCQEDGQDAAQGMVQIAVEDNGIGFEEQFLEKIFQPFQRLHGRSEFEGTGMGLAICRKIVERHGGSITAHSVPGQGSTFTITLPVVQKSPSLE